MRFEPGPCVMLLTEGSMVGRADRMYVTIYSKTTGSPLEHCEDLAYRELIKTDEFAFAF